jgi:hypothetical protein
MALPLWLRMTAKSALQMLIEFKLKSTFLESIWRSALNHNGNSVCPIFSKGGVARAREQLKQQQGMLHHHQHISADCGKSEEYGMLFGFTIEASLCVAVK